MTNKKRILFKTMTWRLTASSATLLLVYLTTKELKAVGVFALFEIIVKTSLYYFHEKAWGKVNKKVEVEIQNKAS